MKKISLVIIGPDEHYIKDVARCAVARGLVDEVKVSRADPNDFAHVMDGVRQDGLIIAKGMVETADFLRIILGYDNKRLVKGPLLSHVAVLFRRVLWWRTRPLVLTDPAINIAPDAVRKAMIVKNAIEFVRRAIGIQRPVVSILTPAGKLNPAIKSSLDADFVIQELAREDAVIRMDQLDTAISSDARRAKKLDGPVADIILADNLDSGNELYKMHTMRAGYDAAGLVLGAAVPIVLNSRSDSARSKLMSIKYARKMLSGSN